MRPSRRVCVGCGDDAAPAELIGLIFSPTGTLVVDVRGRLPGKGLWVHCSRACVGEAARESGCDPNAWLAELRDWLRRTIMDGLSMAAAGGGAVGGFERLLQAMTTEEVAFLVLADDASERTVRSIGARANERIPTVRLGLTRDELGRIVGQPQRAALGVLDVGSSHYALTQLKRWLVWGDG